MRAVNDVRVGVIAVAASLAAGFSIAVPPAAAATSCFGAKPTIVGTNGDDRLRGTKGRDVIQALDGDDTIKGLGGDDLLCGDRGWDQVWGGAGDDSSAEGSRRGTTPTTSTAGRATT